MDQTQFLDKYRALQTPANSVLLAVLKLWLLEGKSDDEIAAALGKERSTATRKIGNICKYFGTDEKGTKEQRQQLVLLFRTYCSDFEVHSSLYPDWMESSSGDRPSIPTKNGNTAIKTISTSFEPLSCDHDISHNWTEYDENIWVGRVEQSEALCQNILGDFQKRSYPK